ncbi:MAG TPA: hypothetical protein VIP77_09085 [Jiangellaceae bacterium]
MAAVAAPGSPCPRNVLLTERPCAATPITMIALVGTAFALAVAAVAVTG